MFVEILRWTTVRARALSVSGILLVCLLVGTGCILDWFSFLERFAAGCTDRQGAKFFFNFLVFFLGEKKIEN